MTDTTEAREKGREPQWLKRYRDFWESERAAAWLYRALADLADDESARTLRHLADTEDIHAKHWEDLLRRSGSTEFTFRRPPWRERMLLRIARRFGIERVLPVLIRLEAADAGKYLGVPEAPTSMSEDEVQHGRSLAMLGKGTPSRIAAIESRHRVGSGGALRAGTFGINDGLLSNLSLVMGIAGGTGNSKIVLLAGIAGLLAGSFSMAAGEWVSVRSQRELYEREIAVEREELTLFPEEETAELALIYRAKGIEANAAQNLAERIMQRPSAALDTLAREELGLDPNDLASPWVAASASFTAFAVGAFIPVVPFLITHGHTALWAAGFLSGVALTLVGTAISLFTGRHPLMSALRMLVIGAAAAAITYGVGSVIGVHVS